MSSPTLRIPEKAPVDIDLEACGNLLVEYGMEPPKIQETVIEVRNMPVAQEVPGDFLRGEPSVILQVSTPLQIEPRISLVSLSLNSIMSVASERNANKQDTANGFLVSGLYQLAFLTQTTPDTVQQEMRSAASAANLYKIRQGALTGVAITGTTAALAVAAETVGSPVPAVTVCAGALALAGSVLNTMQAYAMGRSRTAQANNALQLWPHQIRGQEAGSEYVDRIQAGKAPHLITFTES